MSAPGSRPTAGVGLLRTVKAVAWSFIGLRKGSDFDQDVKQLNPLHIVAVGIAAAILLVLGLVGLVHWVT
ncbi:DUF2970 domain-containing protein [Xylophilus sp. ASV27]|uniref:DUF2970 domain-containing protein n=1 Tax=Xylophilus sp. ASV27 TaxID=2795129 RepID=UPI0018EB1893